MSPESIITSVKSEQRWLRETGHNFNHLSRIVNMQLCVFKVPKKVSDAKPEAYIPRRLGLGPYHHLRPEFHAINKRKLVAILNFYAPEIFQNIRHLVASLVKLEPVIRAYYDQFLDLEIETLARIIAIDGLYLLYFMNNYLEMKDVAGDVLMLENQIPMLLLKKVRQFVEVLTTGDPSSIQAYLEGRSTLELGPTDDKALLNEFEAFFEDQSPFELLFLGEQRTKYDHVLHLMYSMIVRGCSQYSQSANANEVVQVANFLDKLGVPWAGIASQVLSFVTAIPWDKISGMFKRDGPDPTVTVEKIDIPSVTQMTEVAGIKFVHTKGGIMDVRFVGGGGDSRAEKKFCLPWIKITATTEIVLRNLVAFEELVSARPGATLELAEYVDLMCGIIDTRRDVEILREAGIVRGDMDDDEIVRIFNGINRSEKTKEKKEEKSGVEKAVEGVNATYNSLMRVKMKKLAGKYGQGCWKVMSLAATIVVVVLLTLQAYCSVFGCSRWFGNDDDAVDGAALTQHPML